jgi:prevent-host-death family protein
MIMVLTTIHHAKTNLSGLIERAERGEEIVIARGKKPVVRLVPVAQPPKNRVPGMFKGEFELKPSFFEPLPPDELEGWN